MRSTRGVSGYPDGRTARLLCLTLLRMGFAKPCESPHMLVRSYRTVSPLPVLVAQSSAVSLCCTVREVAPTWLAPALCPTESRLSSNDSRHPRLPDSLTVSVKCTTEKSLAVEVFVHHRVQAWGFQVERLADARLVGGAKYNWNRSLGAKRAGNCVGGSRNIGFLVILSS